MCIRDSGRVPVYIHVYRVVPVHYMYRGRYMGMYRYMGTYPSIYMGKYRGTYVPGTYEYTTPTPVPLGGK